MFIRAGSVAAAASEYAKLAASFPHRPDYHLYAGAAHEALGLRDRAETYYVVAARAYGMQEVRHRAALLVKAVPRPRPSGG
jgi:hypothetical protein